ncbi:MAG: hypothetical protein A2150_04035 [Candidatus Muproteobacteria bacterium RBG_16_64_11]|uniref:Uncharacterized protein n=1 Tax=Candidatus Muproteobacteria bacterium RBG_16_64_11 TaxID=1817758 RepID=A0A1F6TD33_9PROT|nr:MAG: hypothetical protein A2150_04035 [Candidatus Muproteobacteria bacterium RBG_16_64_11]
MRIDVAAAERLAGGILDDHRLAGLEAGQGRGLGIDLVAEHPQMPGTQAVVFAGTQAQGGEGHGGIG